MEFKTPIVYDLSIPDAYNVESLIKISCRILKGEKVNKKKVNCISTMDRLWMEDLELLTKTYGPCGEDIFLIHFEEDRQSRSVMFDALYEQETFRHEWFLGHGDMFEFRTGEREKLTKELKLDKDLKTAIHDICNKFQPYIGLTNSPAKCE